MTRSFLENLRYTFKGTCTCDGHYTEKYRKDEYEFRWRKGSYKFRMKQYGVSITMWLPIAEAEDYLKRLHELKEAI